MSLRVVLLVAGFGALAAIAACDLNPQPLPPGGGDSVDNPSGGSTSGGFGGKGTSSEDESAGSGVTPPSPQADGGTQANGDGGGGDAGEDASDDASTDASDDGG